MGCGMGTRLLENFMFYFYVTLVLCVTCEAIFQIGHRGSQSIIQVFFVAIFMAAGCFYILFQAGLIVVSLFKIATGRVGGWVVTARGKQQTSTAAGDKNAEAMKIEAPEVAESKDSQHVEGEEDANAQ